jgi:biotin-dependent carboxylase-like uncharacterized protein
MILVQQAMPLTLVQDLGRFGYRRYGVGTAGAMDTVALQVGNLMLGNPAGAAAIEVNLFPFRLRFLADTAFALTGADCGATLDGRPLLPWWAMTAREGQELRLVAPTDGARAYLCVGGGIDVPLVLGSRSTQLRGAIGGFEGRALQKDDAIAIGAPGRRVADFGVLPPRAALAQQAREVDAAAAADAAIAPLSVRVIPAGEYPVFTPDSQDAFWRSPWQVTLKSNRTGYRLEGAHPLELERPLEMRSYGVVAGLVQVPPSGQPIIQLADANVSGGYPKIATVIHADLWRLGQARPHDWLNFVQTTPSLAVVAADELQRYLDRIARLAERARMAPSN